MGVKFGGELCAQEETTSDALGFEDRSDMQEGTQDSRAGERGGCSSVEEESIVRLTWGVVRSSSLCANSLKELPGVSSGDVASPSYSSILPSVYGQNILAWSLWAIESIAMGAGACSPSSLGAPNRQQSKEILQRATKSLIEWTFT